VTLISLLYDATCTVHAGAKRFGLVNHLDEAHCLEGALSGGACMAATPKSKELVGHLNDSLLKTLFFSHCVIQVSEPAGALKPGLQLLCKYQWLKLTQVFEDDLPWFANTLRHVSFGGDSVAMWRIVL
jgi:hypothetical protein